MLNIVAPFKVFVVLTTLQVDDKSFGSTFLEARGLLCQSAIYFLSIKYDSHGTSSFGQLAISSSTKKGLSR
jgi:hypothetical protein